jgi:hypothetical protein
MHTGDGLHSHSPERQGRLQSQWCLGASSYRSTLVAACSRERQGALHGWWCDKTVWPTEWVAVARLLAAV